MAKWKFPLTNGGQEDGFNDPGVNTFVGDFEKYVAREAIQNVLDAKRPDEEAVRIHFDRRSLKKNELPGVKDLFRINESCLEYYEKDAKAKSFFTMALNLLEEKNIPVLSIRDYNTTGLTGSDEDRESNWYSLIRSVGSSQKGENAGGSFGIGKNAPFAASALRMVFYSTKLADNSVAFQGIARLVTHRDEKGKTTQGTGYYGATDSDDYPISIRIENDIPAYFRRTEQGTDVHIIGYLGSDDWKKQLERATLEHFWPAISWGNLIVEIGDDVVINSSTLLNRMDMARADYVEFYNEAYAYYDAHANAAPEHTFEETLNNLKEVCVSYRIGDINLPNQVAMIRKTGMVIYKHSFKGLRLKFAGAFVCANEVGNRILRNMEPPRHDEWDVDRPEKGASRKIQTEYRTWLRKILIELSPKVESKTLEVDELADFLPDYPTSDSGVAKGNMTGEDASAFTDSPQNIDQPKIEIVALTPRRQEVLDSTGLPDKNGDGRDNGENDEGTGNDPDPKGKNKGEGSNNESAPPPKPTGNKGGAPHPTVGKRKQSGLTSKAFADAKLNEYIICLRSELTTTVSVRVSLVGEDDFTEEISLQGARDRDTNQVLSVNGNRIETVELTSNVLRRIAVNFGDSIHYAVNIETNEI